MDFITQQEVNQLKGERNATKEAVEAAKYSFQHQLEKSMGKKMMEELEHPTKPSFWVGLKYRYARWKTIRDGKKKEKQLKKGGF